MSERPTPETDDQPTINAINDNGYQIPCVDIEFARKLERERDEARQDFLVVRKHRDQLNSLVQSHDACWDEARQKLAKITKAAEAVIDRWEQPAWKDTEPTAAVIYRLRDALGREAE